MALGQPPGACVFSLKISAAEKYNENSLFQARELRIMTGGPAPGCGFSLRYTRAGQEKVKFKQITQKVFLGASSFFSSLQPPLADFPFVVGALSLLTAMPGRRRGGPGGEGGTQGCLQPCLQPSGSAMLLVASGGGN